MKATDISGQAPGGKRTKLHEVLPLDTPFLIQVFPVYACNFKCNYCIFSVDKSKRGFFSDAILLKLDAYKRCVDDMKQFNSKIKVVRFVGVGEPLLHKRIVDMVRYTVDANVSHKVEILTNGSLLSKKMSADLIDAGLNRMVISIQGTSQEKYFAVCGVKVKIDELVENIKYYYENKGSSELYIKIIDTALDGPEDEISYKLLFGDICDTIAIEHTVPIHNAIDFEPVFGSKKNDLTQFGLPVSEIKVCPQAFFHMQINPDGRIVPCYSWDYPRIIGNCNDSSLVDIWHGESFREFRRSMLDGLEHASEACVGCNIIKFRSFVEDDLAPYADRLKPFYE